MACLASTKSRIKCCSRCDNDRFIPREEEIKDTFLSAQHTWRKLVSGAETIQPSCVPRGTSHPSITLKDVLALPRLHPKDIRDRRGGRLANERRTKERSTTWVHVRLEKNNVSSIFQASCLPLNFCLPMPTNVSLSSGSSLHFTCDTPEQGK
jgi:hypothetical protein